MKFAKLIEEEIIDNVVGIEFDKTLHRLYRLPSGGVKYFCCNFNSRKDGILEIIREKADEAIEALILMPATRLGGVVELTELIRHKAYPVQDLDGTVQMEPFSRWEWFKVWAALSLVIGIIAGACWWDHTHKDPAIEQNKQEMAQMKADLSELKRINELERSRVAALREALAKKGIK